MYIRCLKLFTNKSITCIFMSQRLVTGHAIYVRFWKLFWTKQCQEYYNFSCPVTDMGCNPTFHVSKGCKHTDVSVTGHEKL